MSKLLAVHVLMVCAMSSVLMAGELPKKSIQCITPETERKKVHLEPGELLLVEISNPAGNATGMKIDYGATGLKLVHSGIRRETDDDGHPFVGSANLVLLFEAPKVASGKLKVILDQTFAKTDPFQLEITVKAPAGAGAK